MAEAAHVQEELPYRQAAGDHLRAVVKWSKEIASDLAEIEFPVDRHIIFTKYEKRPGTLFSRSRTELEDRPLCKGWVLHWDFYDRSDGRNTHGEDPAQERRQVGTLLSTNGDLIAYDMPDSGFGMVGTELRQQIGSQYDQVKTRSEDCVVKPTFSERERMVPRRDWGSVDSFFEVNIGTLGVFDPKGYRFSSVTTSHVAVPVPSIARIETLLGDLAHRAGLIQ